MATERKTSMTLLEGGGPLNPAAAVVLYNHRTGVIFSTHYFSVVNDAKLPDKDELERVAREHAVKDGCEASTHKALHVDPAALKRGVGYRVAKGVLTEVKAGRLKPKPLAASRKPLEAHPLRSKPRAHAPAASQRDAPAQRKRPRGRATEKR